MSAAHRTCIALAATLLALPGSAAAHSLVTSAHSLASDGKGTRIMTVSFGAARQSASGATWLCPATLGVTKGALDRPVVFAQGAFFIAADAGPSRSDDGGCTWTPTPLPSGTLTRLAADGDALWALAQAGEQSRVFRRVDGAWQDAKLPAGVKLSNLIAGHGGVWGAGTDSKGKGVVAIRQGGAWQLRALPATDLPELHYMALAWHPGDADDLLVRRVSASSLDTLLRSVDGGQTWAEAFQPKAGVDASSAVWLPGQGTGTLLIGSTVAGVWRLSGGEAKKLPGAPRVGCLMRQDGAVLGCTDNFAWGAAVMRSDDEGETWAPEFCFAQLSGPPGCASTCAAAWPGTQGEFGIQPGKGCGLPTNGGSDAGGADDAGTPDRSTPQPGADAGGGGGAVTARRDEGCNGGRPGGSPVHAGALLLLMAAALLARRRSPR